VGVSELDSACRAELEQLLYQDGAEQVKEFSTYRKYKNRFQSPRDVAGALKEAEGVGINPL